MERGNPRSDSWNPPLHRQGLAVGGCQRSHEFQWGIGEIVTALLEAGLIVEVLKEYPYSNGCKLFERMREASGRRMFPPLDVPSVPLMYGIVARSLNSHTMP